MKNPSAFPLKGVTISAEHGATNRQPGMTLRDYFAGQALMGLCVSREVNIHNDPALAYRIADAMLTEREKAS